MTRAAAACTALLAAAVLAGCGERDLWDRWRADRMAFHARRQAAKVAARGRSAAERDVAGAQAALEAVTAEFPAARWGTPPARGPARDVALTAAGAAAASARLAAACGDDEGALARWREAAGQWGALPGVVSAAHAGAAAALARLGRHDEALAERTALGALDPLGDPDRPGPVAEVLAAPLAAAGDLREEGREAEASALLAQASQHFAAALSRARGSDALAVARALAGIRVALGDGPGALAALRVTLDGLRAWEVPPQVAAMAACALEGGEPDSAITYARWAASASNTRASAGTALLVAARAWEAEGVTDSAFAAYAAIFDRWTDAGSVGIEAHFRRACLLEKLGQWERARAEFVALGAAAPSHPRAFEAALRVVRHHMDAGEYELARLEGGTAVERAEYLLATNRDPRVQLQGGVLRGELLIALGRTAPAESSLVDLWRRFPEDSTAEAAALRGAALAELRPGGRATAATIYEALASGATDPGVRRSAKQRLAGRPGGPAAPPVKEARR